MNFSCFLVSVTAINSAFDHWIGTHELRNDKHLTRQHKPENIPTVFGACVYACMHVQ